MIVSVDKLKLYYSGASALGQMQDNAFKSLGGFRSGVMIPNASFNNIFDEIGKQELGEGQQVCKCIFIKNEDPTNAITNLNLYITGNQSFEKIKFGVSIPTDETIPVQFMNSQNELPYNVIFYEAYTVGNAVILSSSIVAGKLISLWIIREIDAQTTIPIIIDQPQLNFNWT